MSSTLSGGWGSIRPAPRLELWLTRHGCGQEQRPQPDAQEILRQSALGSIALG